MSRVTTEQEKYTCIANALEPKVAVEVRDMIVTVPETNPYTTLKTQIIKRLSASQEEKTRRLLESEEIGDRKPFKFLRYLQRELKGRIQCYEPYRFTVSRPIRLSK